MSRSDPLVSVIVVTVDRTDLLRNCLAGIAGQEYGNREVWVVDNGSREDVAGMVGREFPGVRVIRLEENRGFAGGNNRALERAGGTYAALINNDAVPSPTWLSAMVEEAEKDPRIGAVAPLILDGNRPGKLDSCGVAIALDGMSRQSMRGRPVPPSAEPGEALVASGCSCLIRMEALSEVGLFDERFFAYCEDTDLGLRLRRAGWKAVTAPRARVTHYYSLTGGKFSLRKIYWVERNHVWVALKNFPWFLLLLLPAMTVWRYLVHLYSLAFGKGDSGEFISSNNLPPVLWTLLRANVDALLKSPEILLQRWREKFPRRMGTWAFTKILFRHRISFYEMINGN